MTRSASSPTVKPTRLASYGSRIGGCAVPGEVGRIPGGAFPRDRRAQCRHRGGGVEYQQNQSQLKNDMSTQNKKVQNQR
jgi:hypothetical protein